MSDGENCTFCGNPQIDHVKDDGRLILCQVYRGRTVTMAELRALQFKARAGQLVMPFHKEAIRARVRAVTVEVNNG